MILSHDFNVCVVTFFTNNNTINTYWTPCPPWLHVNASGGSPRTLFFCLLNVFPETEQINNQKQEPLAVRLWFRDMHFLLCSYQDCHAWRLDRDVDGIEVCPFDVPHTLHVNVKYTDEVLRLDVLYSSFTRAIHVPRKHCVLDEFVVVDPRLHHLPCYIMVIWNPPKKEIYRIQMRKATMLLTRKLIYCYGGHERGGAVPLPFSSPGRGFLVVSEGWWKKTFFFSKSPKLCLWIACFFYDQQSKLQKYSANYHFIHRQQIIITILTD